MEAPVAGPAGDLARPSAEPGWRRWLWPGVLASAIFLVLEGIDGFVAVPLRELSSVLVDLLLSAFGFPVTRQGTILATPRVTFDVVPACSGSTTLRVLLFVGILWCGVHPRLTPLRRVAAALLAIPLALLANTFRVSVLVVTGHLAGEEPGEIFHVGTGIAAFTLAMMGCFAITERLAVAEARRPVSARAKRLVLAGLLAFLFAPFLVWCVGGWGSPLDRFGFAFVLPAALWAAWLWRRAPEEGSREGLGTAGFVAALVLHLAATVADVNILKGLALLATFVSLALAAKGPSFALRAAVLSLIAYLGFPTVGYQLQAVTVPVLGAGSVAASLATKMTLALLLAGLLALPFFRRPAIPGELRPASRLRGLQVALAAVLAVFQGYTFSVAAGAGPAAALEMSFVQGEWIGRKHPVPQAEAEMFQGRIWSRRYQRGPEAVDVLVTSTGGDRHRAHPPSYCLTGSGWTVVSEEVGPGRLGDGRTVPMTRMRLSKGENETRFCFWFTDGSREVAGYREMLLEDTLRRLAGRRTDWFLFRVMTECREPVLEQFLGSFQARVGIGEEARPTGR